MVVAPARPSIAEPSVGGREADNVARFAVGYDAWQMELVHVPTLPGASFRLPPQLEGLRRLAYNMWWSWNPRARALFSRIDGLAFSRYRNPIEVLSQPIAWSDLLDDPAFMAECSQVLAEFDRYMAGGKKHWFNREYGSSIKGPIAYFCAEYGFHESVGIYSGGLGVLAGDHIKTASDMALPFCRRRAFSTSTATSARRSMPTATRSTPTPTTT